MPGRIPVEEQTEELREKTDEEFISFVNQQIEDMKKYSNLGSGAEITFFELNNALRSYEQIYLTLIGLYNVAHIEFQRTQEDFDDWYAEKFLVIRSRENPRDVSQTKWASQKEIEMMVRHENKFEYQGYKEQLLTLDRKVAFFRRLLEAWQSQQFILNTLSKNITTEASLSNSMTS